MPLHPYTEALLSAVPIPKSSARRRKRVILTGDVPSPINPPPGCHFHTRCPYAMARCRVESPALREVLPGHLAACHLHDAGVRLPLGQPPRRRDRGGMACAPRVKESSRLRLPDRRTNVRSAIRNVTLDEFLRWDDGTETHLRADRRLSRGNGAAGGRASHPYDAPASSDRRRAGKPTDRAMRNWRLGSRIRPDGADSFVSRKRSGSGDRSP